MNLYKDENVNMEIIGGFSIEETGQEYVVCSYDDYQGEDVTIAIFQTAIIDGEKTLIDIPLEETELVSSYYEKIEEQIMKGEYNE